MPRVIITGSRSYVDQDWIEECLDEMIDKENDVVVHGDCPTGADNFAEIWCEKNGVRQEKFPAEWHIYGRAAGPLRNQKMVDAGARICIAFPTLGISRGTWDCMQRAEEAGIPVVNLGERYGN